MTISTPVQAQQRIILRRRGWAAWPISVVRESRPGVQLVFLLRSVAGSGLVLSPTVRAAELVAGWWMLTTAIYVFNGVTDLTADRGNESQRPIASGRLRLSDAALACVGLSASGLVMCAVASGTDLALGLALLALGWAYSAGPAWKNSASGAAAVIGAGAGLTYAAGLVCRGDASWREALVAAGLAVWVGVCCASKDFSDAPGDRLAGRRTWPVVLGARRGAELLAGSAVAVGSGFAVTIAVIDQHYLPAGLVLAFGSLLLAAVAVMTATSARRQTRRRSYRAFMTTQYATNLALIMTG
jgi:4-hydroxybenzoate polyprenyltransferase